MVNKKSAKKPGFRNTQGKEAQAKTKKQIKEKYTSFFLSTVIILLVFVNLVFIASVLIKSLMADQAPATVSRPQVQRAVTPERERLLKVEVLNGCGISGIANGLTDYLRKRDVDVVYFGNFESFSISETLVIDRRDYGLKNARTIGNIIGVKDDRMFPQLSPERQLDVTIIIGKNYNKLKAFN